MPVLLACVVIRQPSGEFHVFQMCRFRIRCLRCHPELEHCKFKSKAGPRSVLWQLRETTHLSVTPSTLCPACLMIATQRPMGTVCFQRDQADRDCVERLCPSSLTLASPHCISRLGQLERGILMQYHAYLWRKPSCLFAKKKVFSKF